MEPIFIPVMGVPQIIWQVDGQRRWSKRHRYQKRIIGNVVAIKGFEGPNNVVVRRLQQARRIF